MAQCLRSETLARDSAAVQSAPSRPESFRERESYCFHIALVYRGQRARVHVYKCREEREVRERERATLRFRFSPRRRLRPGKQKPSLPNRASRAPGPISALRRHNSCRGRNPKPRQPITQRGARNDSDLPASKKSALPSSWRSGDRPQLSSDAPK